MFVLCDNCSQHYDDEAQSEECAGIGRKASDGNLYSAHIWLKMSTAIESHKFYTGQARLDRNMAGVAQSSAPPQPDAMPGISVSRPV